MIIKMKSEKGLGLIGTIFLVIVITVLVFAAVYFFRIQYSKESLESMKTNMLSVQAKVKTIERDYILSKKEEDLKGTPLKDMQEDEVMKVFLEKNVMETEKEGSKYYVLNQENLHEMELNKIVLPENNYYIVDYTSHEVAITSGFEHSDGNIYYTLTQIQGLE